MREQPLLFLTTVTSAAPGPLVLSSQTPGFIPAKDPIPVSSGKPRIAARTWQRSVDDPAETNNIQHLIVTKMFNRNQTQLLAGDGWAGYQVAQELLPGA